MLVLNFTELQIHYGYLYLCVAFGSAVAWWLTGRTPWDSFCGAILWPATFPLAAIVKLLERRT